MKLARGLVLIVLWVAPVAIAGDIYVWRDHAGVDHYTTDLANMPEEFRGSALTVAKEWNRADPPSQPVPAPVTSAVEPASTVPSRDLYEAAYLAGLRAGEQERQAAFVGDTTNFTQNVQQSVQIQPQAALPNEIVFERLVPVPVIVDRRRRADRDRSRGEGNARSGFVPAQRAPFLQGPAGPPPISDR